MWIYFLKLLTGGNWAQVKETSFFKKSLKLCTWSSTDSDGNVVGIDCWLSVSPGEAKKTWDCGEWSIFASERKRNWVWEQSYVRKWGWPKRAKAYANEQERSEHGLFRTKRKTTIVGNGKMSWKDFFKKDVLCVKHRVWLRAYQTKCFTCSNIKKGRRGWRTWRIACSNNVERQEKKSRAAADIGESGTGTCCCSGGLQPTYCCVGERGDELVGRSYR